MRLTILLRYCQVQCMCPLAYDTSWGTLFISPLFDLFIPFFLPLSALAHHVLAMTVLATAIRLLLSPCLLLAWGFLSLLLCLNLLAVILLMFD